MAALPAAYGNTKKGLELRRGGLGRDGFLEEGTSKLGEWDFARM